MSHTERNCDNCGKSYMADNRNLRRGWGLCCSKSCAASKREKARPDYDPKVVAHNNLKRAGLLTPETSDVDYYNSTWADDDQWGDCDLGIHEPD